LKDLISDLVFVGIVCFENPIREGVLEAIKKIQGAGIAIRLCTGDHPTTASSIARKCGIFMGAAGDVVEGPALAEWVRQRDLTNLRVLARSSPENKAYVVSALRGMNRVVAFLGDGLNDQLALKAADVSFSMAIAGVEVAKQASHIALLNDDLRSVVKVITWGRCLRDSRAQFHNIYNATSIAIVIITFVSATSSTMMKPALAPVQLLWIMVLIIPLTTALGLSTDQPSELWLEANTFRKLSSYTSYILRCIAQTSVVLFLFLFKLPGHPSTENITNLSNRTRTLVFNSLAFMLVLYCSVNWTLGSGRNLRKVNRTFILVLVIGEIFPFGDWSIVLTFLFRNRSAPCNCPMRRFCFPCGAHECS
jgi:Ca2+-transporting ATPase